MMKILYPAIILLFLSINANSQIFRSLIYDKAGHRIPIPRIILKNIGVSSFQNDSNFIEYMDSIQKVNHKFRVVQLVTGNIYDYSVDSICHKKFFRYESPFNVFNFGHNTVEGMQIPVSFHYFKSDSLGKALSIAPTISYSFDRRSVDGDIQIWKRFKGINNPTLVVDAGSDVVDFNSNSSFSEMANAIHILYFEQNFRKYYYRKYLKLGYSQDVVTGFNVGVSFLYRDSKPEENRNSFKFFNSNNRDFSANVPDNPEIGNDLFVDRRESILNFSFKYTPRQKYSVSYNRNDTNSKFPTFTFNYKKSISNLFLSVGDFDFAEFGILQKLKIGVNGRIDYRINTGLFLNHKKVFFENYRHFDTHSPILAMSNIVNTFRLLPFYQFSSSTRFLEAHANWDSQKMILKQIPFMGRTSIVECLYFNYLSTDRLSNYVELGYGIRNIFAVLGLEAVTGFRNGKYDSAGIKIVLNIL